MRIIGSLTAALLGLVVFGQVESHLMADVTMHSPPRYFDLSRVTVAQKQKELGKDIDKLFGFVRDEVGHDVYSGVLRGGQGALVSLAGNSLDKSVLLAELLQQAGHRVRFAHGRLEDSAAKRLVKRVFPRLKAAGEAAPKDERLARFLQSLQRNSTEQGKWLMRTLKKSGVKLPKQGAGRYQQILDTLKDHWWVQVFVGGKWLDLDPSFADAKQARSYAKADKTCEKLEEKLYHRVTLRLLLEEVQDGKRKTRTLLTHEARACDLTGAPLFLGHRENSWKQPVRSLLALGKHVGGGTGLLGELDATPATVYEKIKPLLLVGARKFVVGEPFEILRLDKEAKALASKNSVRAAGEWIEANFKSPSGQVRTTRRAVFDRLGVAARAAKGGDQAMRPIGGDHPRFQVFCLSFCAGPIRNPRVCVEAKNVKASKQVARSRSRTESYRDVSTDLQNLNDVVHFFSGNVGFKATLGDKPGPWVVFAMNAPRLIISSTSRAKGREVISVDLRFQDFRPVVTSPKADWAVPYFRLIRGVIDGHVEEGALQLLYDPKPDAKRDDDSPEGRYSTASILRRHKKAGGAMLLLKRPGDEAALVLDDDVKQRIRAELAGGNLVAMPDKGVEVLSRSRTAWWRVHPRTGSTIGVTEAGLHAAAAEKGILENRYAVVDWKMREIHFIVEQGGRVHVNTKFYLGSSKFLRVVGHLMRMRTEAYWLL